MKLTFTQTLQSFHDYQSAMHPILPWILLPVNLCIALFATLTSLTDEP
ncbi:MAG: hypothetical protein WCO56_24120 [Verrucomicrobiota bacterium]